MPGKDVHSALTEKQNVLFRAILFAAAWAFLQHRNYIILKEGSSHGV